MRQAFRFDSYCSSCRAVFGGRRSIFRVKSQQEGCYSGRQCATGFGHLEYIASCSIFVGVQWCLFKSHRCKWLSRHISIILHLQPIVLSSLTFRPASVTHVQIGEDMIYTSVRQAFGFAHSCSCSKGVFWHEAQWTHGISQYKMAAARAFTNFKQLLLENLLFVFLNKSCLDCWQPVDSLEPSFEAIWLFRSRIN